MADILDYIDKMQIMYGDKEPSSMVPEPRRTGFKNGSSYDYNSFEHKINELKAHFKRYKKRGGTISFEQFAPLFATENFATGGSAGQLVQPSDDGSRPGYNGRGGARPNTGGDRSEFIDYEARIKNPGKKKLDIAEKVHGNKPEYKGLKGFELWKKLKNFQRSNIIQESTTGKPSFKPKKNQLGKNDFIKLVSDNKGKTYNEFVEIIKKYKTKDGQPFTKQIIADRLRAYKLSGSFKREEAQGLDKTKKAAAEKKRKLNLKEVDRTKAKGVGNFQYHHVRQIAGGVPLTTDDVLIINKRVNAQIGGATNKTLNRISEAIRKNNKLALEAMNAKNEGLALEYMKRSDNLNAQAEKIVNSAIDKLPKKYKGYVGFNQFTLPRNEYGLPISNEPMIIKKVGGMPVSKNAIDLTTLNLEQEAEFRKIVREQAEAGKTGKINLKTSKALQSFFKRNGIKCNLANGINCGQPEAYVKSINELKAKAAAGDKKAAEQLVKVTKGMSKGGTLLRSLIGPGAILFEPVYEGVIAANKVLDGKPLNQAWAESYLSYLDSERVDPKTLEREEMLYRQIEGPERKVKGGQGTVRDTINIDAPGASKLRPLFAAEDTMAAFQKAKAAKEKVFQTRGVDRLDIRDKAAADIRDMRKTGSVDFAEQIINDPATQKALSDAQEYIAAKRGENKFSAQSAQVDEQRRKKAMKAEDILTIQDVKNKLKDIGDYYGQGYTPFGVNKLFEEFGVQNPGYGITKVGPATGKYNQAQGLQDYLNSMRMQQIADAGGVANMAGGGIAGLSGGDKSGRPPESGPASQGLRSLIKNGRKL